MMKNFQIPVINLVTFLNISAMTNDHVNISLGENSCFIQEIAKDQTLEDIAKIPSLKKTALIEFRKYSQLIAQSPPNTLLFCHRIYYAAQLYKEAQSPFAQLWHHRYSRVHLDDVEDTLCADYKAVPLCYRHAIDRILKRCLTEESIKSLGTSSAFLKTKRNLLHIL